MPSLHTGSVQQAAAKDVRDLPLPIGHVESGELLLASGPLLCFSLPGGHYRTVPTAAFHLVPTLLQVWPVCSHSHKALRTLWTSCLPLTFPEMFILAASL